MDTEQQTFLQLSGISKQFTSGKSTTLALHDVSLDISEQEFVCLLGPSGCGKSTLLRIIAGLEKQDRGNILCAGKRIHTLPPGQRGFAIVFQSYALFPNLSVYDNVGYGLHGSGLERREKHERIMKNLELVGLPHMKDKLPAQLSGGEQQRVALARAIILSPRLLLLDEPLSALDARVRERLRREIRIIQRELGLTTIMVTHDQEEALTMGDRILVMEEGRIIQSGSPGAIYNKPQASFVADFIGTVNFLKLPENRDFPKWLHVFLKKQPESRASKMSGRLAIRPEHIILEQQTTGNRPQTSGALPITIEDREFRGSFTRLYCRIGTKSTVFTGEKMIVDTHHSGDFYKGQHDNSEIWAVLPEKHLHFFPDKPGDTDG